MHTIRKTTYLIDGQPISLAFLEALADEHPETVANTSPPAATPRKLFERRGPRRRTAQDDAAFEAAMSRVLNGGT